MKNNKPFAVVTNGDILAAVNKNTEVVQSLHDEVNTLRRIVYGTWVVFGTAITLLVTVFK